MQLTLFTVIIFALCIIPCSGQNVNRNKQELIYPAVYIDIEKVGKGKPIYAGDSDERVWMKLVNNTKWSIYLDMFVFGDDEKTGLFYEVEKVRENLSNKAIPIGYRRGHSGSGESEIKIGESVSFSIPKNHLADNLKIRIDFTYEWEHPEERKSPDYSYTRNSVFITSSDLKRFLNKR